MQKYIWLTLSLIFIVGSLSWRPHSFLAQRALIAPPPHIESFTFGHREVMADSLWIRTIQDFDYCEVKDEIDNTACKGNGWLYHMLDAVTNLSPRFRMPFATGGLALTVIISDYAGASKFFDKAVLAFPKDWHILYRASYHALYEEKDGPKAAKLLIQAAQNGGTQWMYSLASRLYTDNGQKELGLALYKDLKADPNMDRTILKRMAKKLGLPD